MRPYPIDYPSAASPSVILHPRVSTRVRSLACPLESARPAFGDDLVSWYEAGQVLAFPSIDLGLSDSDWAFLNGINLPTTEEKFLKKAKLRNLLAPLGDDTYPQHVLARCFPKDRSGAGRLQQMVGRGNRPQRAPAAAGFPGYRIVGEDVTWRFTRTESEDMHYDAYGDSESDLHHIRLFVNLDDKPRLWGVGPPVEESIALFRDQVRRHADLHPNRLNARLNAGLPWGEVPRHFVSFAPGNAWLVDSQRVAHEIVYGRKLAACTFDVDPASMLDPSQAFPEVVRRAVRDYVTC